MAGVCVAQQETTIRFDELLVEFRASERQWSKDLIEWKRLRKKLTTEKRLDDLPPPPVHPFGEFAPRASRIARAKPGTSEASTALAFLFAPSLNSDPYADPCYPEGAKLALTRLAVDHADDAVITKVAKMAARRRYLIDDIGLEPIAAFAAAVRASKQSPETKAYASYALASALYRLAGKTGIEARRLELVTSARSLFAVAAKQEVGVYTELASRFLTEIDTAQIGMTAIATEGQDAIGKTLRLSDHEGKVVLIDFWGFW